VLSGICCAKLNDEDMKKEKQANNHKIERRVFNGAPLERESKLFRVNQKRNPVALGDKTKEG